MAIRTDQYTNSLTVVDTVNANAPLNLIPQGTGAVNIPGTGQNLIARSQALTTSPWVLNLAPTTASYTDPLGGSTATQFTTSAAGSGVFQTLTGASGVTYTWSIYVKYISGDGTIKIGNDLAPNTATLVFNSSAGTITSTGVGLTATSVANIGNGWYRVSGTYVSTGTPMAVIIYANNANAMSWAAWGVQYEVGAVVNTYIPTTTTAIYGTPSLSFSGVAGIGLQSDGSMYHQPAGTGALQAQATTSTATGGNARGANAVDWQTLRSTNTMVANGLASVLTGGQNNTASSYTAFVGAGANNSATGPNSAIVAGNASYAPGQWSFIGSGNGNTAGGFYNFIGGGQANGGTAQAAVTTQSATMNGTTAVTLAASNASIKIGQYILGTSISANTYVAAISGTSLTLSQAASGSSTSTLSFYTPHGVVVGGGNNTATGSYSFIGGGGDAGTAGNRNVASGDWSVVAGGIKNVASGRGSFIGGGGIDAGGNIGGNVASGVASVLCGGRQNVASGEESIVMGGAASTANGLSSMVQGRTSTTRGITGNVVFAGSYSPLSGGGSSQLAFLVLARQTTDATPIVLTNDGIAASTTNQVILPNNSAYYFKGTVIANVTGGGNTKGWTIEGAIKRGANAASTALVGTPTVTSGYADAGASTWAITATADTTNGGLAITFTGQASTTIRCVAKLETTEVTF